MLELILTNDKVFFALLFCGMVAAVALLWACSVLVKRAAFRWYQGPEVPPDFSQVKMFLQLAVPAGMLLVALV